MAASRRHHGKAPLCAAGAYLYDVRNCSDMRKDATEIAEVLFEMGCSVVGGEANGEKFGGWTLDNTKPNMSALRQLREDPKFKVASGKWMNIGCKAHGGGLSMKDFCKYDADKGKNAKANAYGVQWMEEVNRNANMIANFLHDSSGASEPLVAEQDSIYKTRPAVPMSVPTRFATNLFAMHGTQQPEDAAATGEEEGLAQCQNWERSQGARSCRTFNFLG